ncbi:uncharacterized protein LTR77_002630 [Saxophila tyrrhenica]|uniref:N-acetyltransferase domain-containing protein n=1 Tax=Saxophila tyrrhenica TaxID=1690608 RepID=A0AAV9PG02_9PEZI|nr:hypothetical protein LTR77_002630 [Saxophila tyrrhenica]
MPLREMRWEDIPQASRVLAAAFFDTGLFGSYMHPHRDKYPDDMSLFYLHALRTEYYSGPDHRSIVTYTSDPAGKDTITGVAHWVRRRAKPSPPGLYHQVMLNTVTAYNYMESFLYPNRAANPTHLDVLSRMGPFVDHHWSGTRSENWYLSRIGVSPPAERRGYGKQMVQYGFDLARAEGVGCSVIAAPGRESWYVALGYDVKVGTTGDFGGEENPLVGVEVATIHFWDNGVEVEGVKGYGEGRGCGERMR